MKPRELHYTLRFIAPAFLGDADQSGRWRTPPIKAQLRQWWRVAYSAQHEHRTNVAAMRADEARLFGAAGDDNGSTGRSLVRLRLDRWDVGTLAKKDWKRLAPVAHPEVDRRIPTADLYLGYGPVTLNNGPLKANAAVQAGESATLTIGLTSNVTDADDSRLRLALHLMHQYGTLGGRSRNGWGSYVLEPVNGTPPWPADLDPRGLRRWTDALALDWAHAIGANDEGRPLEWSTGTYPDWRAVMEQLAQIKIGLRTSFGFESGKGAQAPERRHWLAYPVTNHAVQGWGDARLPNTLRFKLRPTADGQVEGIVFHMPALPPPAFAPDRHRSDIERLWTDVHAHLDRRLRPADGRKAAR